MTFGSGWLSFSRVTRFSTFLSLFSAESSLSVLLDCFGLASLLGLTTFFKVELEVVSGALTGESAGLVAEAVLSGCAVDRGAAAATVCGEGEVDGSRKSCQMPRAPISSTATARPAIIAPLELPRAG